MAALEVKAVGNLLGTPVSCAYAVRGIGLGGAVRDPASPLRLRPTPGSDAGAGGGADRRFLDLHPFIDPGPDDA
jgi:hypothetical protein